MITLFRNPFARAIRAFPRAEHGNVAIMFAFALVPIIGLVGAAVDYSRANSARSALQSALDATALMISREAAGLTEDQIKTRAQGYFDALYNSDASINPLDIVYTPNSGNGATVAVKARGSLPTTFMKVAGFPTIDFGSNATTTWGAARLRVALALDTTGSMADAGKIDALKTATKDLLAQLKSAESKPGDVYVSIIPFSKNVNLGSANYSASWIDWTDWEAEPTILKSSKPSNWYRVGSGDSCPLNNNSHGVRCATSVQSASTTSTVPSSGNFKGLICPSNDTGRQDSTKIGIIYNGCYNSWTECVGAACSCTNTDTSVCGCTGSGSSKTCKIKKSGYYEHTWRPTTSATYTPPLAVKDGIPYATPPHSTWNGCVTDRGTSSAPSNDYDRKVDAPTSALASKYPAEQNSYCSPEVVGLNNNWATMKAQVDNLYPLGATNQPIGLVWGWQSLVGGGPLVSPPKEDNYEYIDAIVLMSDGLNTLNRWYGNGSTTNTLVDARMSGTAGTCANIKAQKDPKTGKPAFTIYTIHVNTDGDPMSQLLKDCASSPDKFWMVTSGGALGAVFNQIATELSKLRLTQ
jgi:Flp pilus assembly protein TadG